MSDVAARIRKVVAEIIGCAPEKVTDESTFEDLGGDSLDQVEIGMALEDEFSLLILDVDIERITSVRLAIDHITKAGKA